MIKVYYTCKKCRDEFSVYVAIGESNDLPADCPACGVPIPDEAQTEVEQAAIDKAEYRNECAP